MHLVDGVKLNTLAINSWLERIGFVSQETFIFHGTSGDNIAFGFKEASLNEIVAVAKEANAHHFILEFPQGYETIVGDRGLKLSGGQRQRIAIARALFRKPQILILDEATSALDNVSEAMVQESINTIAKNRTVMIIAHRLSTIMHADKIIVLDQGKVVEVGRHNELMGKKNYYWRLYHTQAKPQYDDISVAKI